MALPRTPALISTDTRIDADWVDYVPKLIGTVVDSYLDGTVQISVPFQGKYYNYRYRSAMLQIPVRFRCRYRSLFSIDYSSLSILYSIAKLYPGQ